MKRKAVLKFIKSYFFITLGLTINVFGWVGFLIPAKIVGGGITGLSSIIFYITNFPVGLSVLIINSLLVLLAIKILGSKFGLASIFGIATVSGLFFIMPEIITQPLVTDNKFMSALIGGGIAGVGIGIAFVNGGNSGGTDIIALIISKYKNISPGKVLMYIDIIIIALSYFISHNIDTVVYGYVVMGVFAYTLNLILDGAKQSYQLTVMSQKSDIIADKVTHNVGRGVTLVKGVGWYSKQDLNVLLITIRKQDKSKIYKILAETDKNAFISEAKVSAVFGVGFERIKF